MIMIDGQPSARCSEKYCTENLQKFPQKQKGSHRLIQFKYRYTFQVHLRKTWSKGNSAQKMKFFDVFLIFYIIRKSSQKTEGKIP